MSAAAPKPGSVGPKGKGKGKEKEAASPEGGRERRRFPRINRKIQVKYRVTGSGPLPVSGEGETRNVSRGGVRIHLDERLPIGTVLELEMRFPFSPVPFAAKGLVVWVDDHTDAEGRFPAGVRFTEVTMDGGDMVARVFRNHLGI